MPAARTKLTFRGLDRQRLTKAKNALRMILRMDQKATALAAKRATDPILFASSPAIIANVEGVLNRVDQALIQRN